MALASRLPTRPDLRLDCGAVVAGSRLAHIAARAATRAARTRLPGTTRTIDRRNTPFGGGTAVGSIATSVHRGCCARPRVESRSAPEVGRFVFTALAAGVCLSSHKRGEERGGGGAERGGGVQGDARATDALGDGPCPRRRPSQPKRRTGTNDRAGSRSRTRTVTSPHGHNTPRAPCCARPGQVGAAGRCPWGRSATQPWPAFTSAWCTSGCSAIRCGPRPLRQPPARRTPLGSAAEEVTTAIAA